MVQNEQVPVSVKLGKQRYASFAKLSKISVTNFALGARLSGMRYSSMLWMLPPLGPRVSILGRPAAANLLPSDAPPVPRQLMG